MTVSFLIVSCKTGPKTEVDWLAQELTIVEQGEPAPFYGVLMSPRIYYERFRDLEDELLIED